MRFRERITSSAASEERIEEHAVIVYFEYAADSLEPLYDLEEQLEAAIAAAGVGEFDGNEIAVDLSDGSLYMYGPDADALFAVARPLLVGGGLPPQCPRHAAVLAAGGGSAGVGCSARRRTRRLHLTSAACRLSGTCSSLWGPCT